jgi:hypothetical protein
MFTKMKPVILSMAVIVATVIACSKEKQTALQEQDKIAADAALKGDSTHMPGDSTHLPGDSTHLPGDSTHLPHDSTHLPHDTLPHYPHDTLPHYPHDTMPHYPHYPHDSTGGGDSTGVPPIDTFATRQAHSRH